ncbi:MAG: hypothetical protein A2041_10345 [Bacteroidetes bacterium GWA2_31_9b]|nr:MAG: hypothetical protein A2041_10345 [Bacteroidetes bacterium GWA2_31_9b]
MKKQLILIIVFTSILCESIFPQIPESFNYQAVLRNSAGELLKNQSVTIQVSIIENSATGDVVYREQHSKITNNFGMVDLQIGDGTSDLGEFADINWSNITKYIKVEVNIGSGFVNMGTSQILSVPYALFAGTASNLGDEGIYTTDSDTLFVVKDHDGNPVFIVFPDGAKVINNQVVKGKVGGFAVSGRSPTKLGEEEDYLIVTPDSTRIYVNDTTINKGKVGGFAVSGRSPTKEESQKYLDLTKANYFIGHESGQNLNTGLYNSSLGYQSAYTLTDGESNSFIGYQSGYNTNIGNGNLFMGYQTGFSNEDGNYNTFLGYIAGYSNLSGRFNTFLGSFSGYTNTAGSNNTFVGDSTGFFNTEGNYNTFIGTGCGNRNENGTENVFIGNKSGYSNISGLKNVFIGHLSGLSNTTGHRNIMIGSAAGAFAETGTQNIFIGTGSGYNSINTWGNVNIGYLSGYNTTTGGSNVFIGGLAGYTNSTGFSNTFIGIEAGYSFDGDYGNTFLGDHAGYYAKSSHKNVFMGAFSGYNNSQLDTVSLSNVFIGNSAGYNSIGGGDNVFIGFQAGYSNVFSNSNVFLGYESGYNNSTGGENVFIGMNSGHGNTTGRDNVFMGLNSGYHNTEGYENVFIGWLAGEFNTTSLGNVFIGSCAGNRTREGHSNTFIGLHAGYANTIANNNTVLGAWTADTDTLGSANTLIGAHVGRQIRSYGNTILGYNAGPSLIDGDKNIFIGYKAGFNETGSSRLYIDNQISDSTNAMVFGQLDNRNLRFNAKIGINANPTQWENLNIEQIGDAADIRIAGEGNGWNFSSIFLSSNNTENLTWQINHRISNDLELTYYNGVSYEDMVTFPDTGGIVINGNIIPMSTELYSLGTESTTWKNIYSLNSVIVTSDERLKTNISNLDYGLIEILKLRPVKYNWKNSDSSSKKIGLIAQEVDKVIHEVTNTGNDEFKTMGINYSDIIPVLIKGMQEQQVQIENLKTENEYIKQKLNEIIDKIDNR